MKHVHHIIPIHAGGKDIPENRIELSISEHAEAHRILFEKHGKWQDELAWKGLAGLITHYEAAREAMMRGVRKQADNRRGKPGPKSPKQSQFMIKNNPMHNPIHRAKYDALPVKGLPKGTKMKPRSDENKKNSSYAAKFKRIKCSCVICHLTTDPGNMVQHWRAKHVG